MKTANKIFYSIVLAKLLAIGLVVFAAVAQSKLNIQMSPNNAVSQTTIELVKSEQIQTVMISAKRLSAEEKLALDLEQARTLQANAQYNKKIRKLA